MAAGRPASLNRRWAQRLPAGVLTSALAFAGLSAPAWAAESLLVTYIDKPPYYYTDAQGVPRGFLVERVRQIMARADIEMHLESRPPSRAVQELRTGSPSTCSIGWFRTTERDEFARFTRPIYHDRPLLAVVQQEHAAGFSAHGGLSAILARPGIRIGAVAGYSYGDAVDRMLSPLAERIDRAPSPASNLAKLAVGRFDVALFNSEELDHLLSLSPEMARRIVRIELSDVPPGKPRHLMCARQVPTAVIERIDHAINLLRFDRP